MQLVPIVFSDKSMISESVAVRPLPIWLKIFPPPRIPPYKVCRIISFGLSLKRKERVVNLKERIFSKKRNKILKQFFILCLFKHIFRYHDLGHLNECTSPASNSLSTLSSVFSVSMLSSAHLLYGLRPRLISSKLLHLLPKFLILTITTLTAWAPVFVRYLSFCSACFAWRKFRFFLV